MSSKRLDDDALGALRAWTPAQQAALNRQRITKNSKKDVDEDEREEYLKKRGRWTDPSIGLKAHEIKAEELINDFIKTHSPQLDLFLRCFAPPHRALPGFVLLHLAFWWSAPWYLQFLLPFPLIYFIPVWCSLLSLFNASREDRQLWQAYWVILAVMGYVEFLVFGSTLPLFWWPKVKAILCLALYSKTGTIMKERINSSKKLVQEKRTCYGAIAIINPFLPPKEEKKDRHRSEDPRVSRSRG